LTVKVSEFNAGGTVLRDYTDHERAQWFVIESLHVGFGFTNFLLRSDLELLEAHSLMAFCYKLSW
jgi:hypothetical protein